MEDIVFTVHIETIGAKTFTYKSKGALLVLRGEDVGATSGFSVMALSSGDDKTGFVTPLENAGMDDSNPMYVLDKSISQEYLVFIDRAKASTSTPYACASTSKKNIIDLDKEDSLENDVGKARVDVIDIDSPVQTVNCNEEMQEVKGFSIINYALDLNSKSPKLRRMIQLAGSILQVTEIPTTYNGDVVFELPTATNIETSPMDGMEQALDGHVWTRPSTTHLTFPATIRKSYCGGELECINKDCGEFLSKGSRNKTAWSGKLNERPEKEGETTERYGSLKCFYCQSTPVLRLKCPCSVYYVMPLDTRHTRAMIHQGTHMHNVQQGSSKAALEHVRNLVKAAVGSLDGKAGPRKIQMEVVKQLSSATMQRVEGVVDSNVGQVELSLLLQQMYPLVQTSRMKNWVQDFRGGTSSRGEESLIIDLKRRLSFSFIHGSRFPGQSLSNEERCYVFKMSTSGPGSGLDLVNRMRRTGNGDLSKAWVCFDHVHRIDGWSTMAAHVYDPSVQDLMTIAICEMKEEDTTAQILYWEQLNRVVLNNGSPLPDFAGFMADEAQANWRAVRTVYNGGPDNVLEGRERSCLFHWEQSLHLHTQKYIHSQFQDEHKHICRLWRCAETIEEAENQYRFIRAWWASGKVADANIPQMDCWLSWWHLRYPHWRRHVVGTINDQCEGLMPRTNLSESRHASWLAGEGYKHKISLYDASISDIGNVLLQQSKRMAYMEGKYIGNGPSLAKLRDRATSRRYNTPTPVQTSRIVNDTIRGTGLSRVPEFLGDNITVSRKRPAKKVQVVDANSSHRPEYVVENVQRKRRARKLDFGVVRNEEGNLSPVEDDHGPRLRVPEVLIADNMWAIRRTKPSSKFTCQGILSGGGKCKTRVSQSKKGTPAPSFLGRRQWEGRSTEAWAWFCNTNATHVWNVCPHLIMRPPRPPLEWPVAQGTELSEEEILSLQAAGFHLQTVMEAEAGERRPGRYRPGVSEEASSRIDKALEMSMNILDVDVFKKSKHEVFIVETESSKLLQERYRVGIAKNPSCTCRDFQRRVGAGLSFVPCKHLYYLYLRVFGMDINHNMFIHQSSLSDEELAIILQSRRTM